MAGYGDLPYGDSPYKDEGVQAFSATPRSGLVPLSVNFTDLTIDTSSWDWDFGDGSLHSSVQNPSHLYVDDGIFPVSLTADGTTYSRANYIVVNVATPIITPGGGSYSDLLTISMLCATTDSTIRYTTDGSTPSISSPVYSTPIDIPTSTTVKAKAFYVSSLGSSIRTEIYNLPDIKYADIDDSYSGSGHTGTFTDQFTFEELVACSDSTASGLYFSIKGIRTLDSTGDVLLHVNSNTWQAQKPGINGNWRIGNIGAGNVLFINELQIDNIHPVLKNGVIYASAGDIKHPYHCFDMLFIASNVKIPPFVTFKGCTVWGEIGKAF